MIKPIITIVVFALCADLSRAVGGFRQRQHEESYVTLEITNLSYQQPFSEFFVMSHNDRIDPLFTLGQEATADLARLAEDGNSQPLVNSYSGLQGTLYVGTHNQNTPYRGGEKTLITIPINSNYPYITIASMAVNTNDCFVALNGIRVRTGDIINAPGYDAGSEENDELCSSIPGPACTSTDNRNLAPGNGEGFVHVHRGFFGINEGGLTAQGYDWRNPMMRVEVLGFS